MPTNIEFEIGYHVLPEQDMDEYRWLLELIVELRPKRLLEIGVRLCASLCTFSRIPGMEIVVGIDAFHPGWDVSACTHMFLGPGCERRLIKGISYDPEIRRSAANLSPFDVIFIDAGHRYAEVKLDYYSYRAHVRPGGIIAFHDISPGIKYEAVYKLWEEIKLSGAATRERIVDPTREWGGIGVVYVV